MGRLTVVNNPFAPWDGRISREIEPGCKVRDLVAKYSLSEFRVSISVNGVLEPDMDQVIEKGDVITICAQLGDRDTLRIVASIVVVAAVAYFTAGTGVGSLSSLSGGSLGAGATGAGAFATYAIGGALSTGGMMLVNEILPPETPNVSIGGESLSDSNTYGWNEPRNQVNEGSVVPVLYGKHRVAPHVISQRRVFEDNKDKLNLLFFLTEGRSDATTPVAYLNDRLISSYDGAAVSYRRGDITQTNIGGGFDDIVTQKPVGVVLDPNTSDTITVTTDGTAVEKLTVGVTIPGGLYQYVEGGYRHLDLGIYIEYRTVGGGAWTPFDGMSGTLQYTSVENQNIIVGYYDNITGLHSVDPVDSGAGYTPIYETQQVEVTRDFNAESTGFWFYANSPDTIRAQFDHGSTPLAPGQYEVRVTKIKHYEVLSGNTTRYNNLRVDFVEEVIEEPLTYPGRTILGVTSVAQEEIYGSTPVVEVEADRGELLLYDGEWGNSTVVTGRASSNPAWACYDLLTNPLYGGGIHPDNIIESEFQAWADHCDTQGLECNIYIEAGSNMLDTLRKISILGWGQVLQRGTSYGAIYDGVQSRVYTFGMGNILADTFNMSYLERDSRARNIEITYWDKDIDWDRRILARRLDQTSGETDFRKASISLPGCTSRTQADKHAQLALRKNQYITRTVTFEADIDAIHCQVGDVIGVSHDVPRYGISGRVFSGTSTTVTLDREITLTNDPYYITLKYVDDTMETVAVTETNGNFSTLTIASGTFSSTPLKDDGYYVGMVNQTVKDFRIISIRKTQDFQAQVTAVEYRSEIYNFDTAVPDYPTNKLISSVFNLQLAESFQQLNDGTVTGGIDVAWDGFSTEWNVKIWKVGGGNVSPEWNRDVYERRFTIPSLQVNLKQEYRVRVTGLDGLFVEDTITFQLNIPPAPIDLRYKTVDKVVYLGWDQPASDLPISHWEIYQGIDYLDAKKIGTTKTDSFSDYIPAGGGQTFHIVAVDTAGQKSNHAFVGVSLDADRDFVDLSSVTVDGSGSGSDYIWDVNQLIMPFTDPGDDWDTVWQSAYPADYTTKTWADWVADQNVSTYLDAVLKVPGTSWATTSTYTQTWDLGEVYPVRTRVEVDLGDRQAVGALASVTLTHTIEYSADNVNWILYRNEVVADHSTFRYIRLTVTADGDGFSAVALRPVLYLKGKLIKEIGSGSITDATNGETVPINTSFYDVRSLKVTPRNTSLARLGASDFTDVPFPSDFVAFLYDTDNTKVTGDFTYEIEGV